MSMVMTSNKTMEVGIKDGDDNLFSPYQMGTFDLSHRIVMAPMTRCRAINEMPNETLEKYYTQRATPGGLLITEGTIISAIASRYTNGSETGQGWWFPLQSFVPAHCPGIYTIDQVEAWRRVVDSVHAKGAIIFCQLWHVGQVSNQAKILEVVEQFRQAALNAIRAGFDGVEVHAAHSYIVDQFLNTKPMNGQIEEHNGPMEGLTNFLMKVVQAVAETIGPEKVAVRIFSPAIDQFDDTMCNPLALGLSVANGLNKVQSKLGSKLAFFHVTRPRLKEQEVVKKIRDVYEGTFMCSGGYTKDEGMETVGRGEADLIAYGRDFIANPDLVHRFKVNASMNKYKRESFYTHDPILGYTDYPFLGNEIIKPL